MSRAPSARVPPRWQPANTLVAIAQIFTMHLPDQRQEGRIRPPAHTGGSWGLGDVLKATRREPCEDFKTTKDMSAGRSWTRQRC